MISKFSLVFLILFIIIQIQFWFSNSGFFQFKEINQQINELKNSNLKLQKENRNIKETLKSQNELTKMIEKKARMELGMIKKDEIFILSLFSK